MLSDEKFSQGVWVPDKHRALTVAVAELYGPSVS